MSSVRHESGKLKQNNKKHKGSSKALAKRALGPGRTAGSVGSGNGKQQNATAVEARNKKQSIDQQQKKQRRAEIFLKKRVGSSHGPPKLIGIIALSDAVDLEAFLQSALQDASWSSASTLSTNPLVHIEYAKHKANVSLLFTNRNLESIINVAKIANTLVFITNVLVEDTNHMIDSPAHIMLSTLRAIGLPESLCYTQGLVQLAGKSLIEMKKLSHRHFDSAVGSQVRFAEDTDASMLSRQFAAITPKNVNWRGLRSYMLCERAELLDDGATDGTCSVRVGGYLRGQPLNVQSLVHVGGGTYPISKISSALGPYESTKYRAASFLSHEVLANVAEQESLVIEATGDAIIGEQTWPSEEEMRQADELLDVGKGRERRRVPEHLPAGMSSYQADWYMDEDGQWNAEDAGSDGGDDAEFNAEDDATLATSARPLKSTASLAKDNEAFPDEMDTPEDVAARHRFARYRALQSFRSSPWHPKENLPQEYSKIYAFENFGMAQRRAVAAIEDVSRMHNHEILNSNAKLAAVSVKSRSSSFCAAPRDADAMDIPVTYNPLLVSGSATHVKSSIYVEIEVRAVPLAAAQAMITNLAAGLTLYSLLPDENKLSVLHFNVQLVDGELPIKCKEPMLFHVGFRTFSARPIFSEANLNCDKHKMERFLQPNRYVVASIYGPITYLPCPALMFRDSPSRELVGTGTLLSIDPDRIILKKIVLTGIPIRVRKRYAVIKHMFFDPQDVRWFKPAELYTKHGLRGNIKEPVGTHGLFKAVFSAPITQNDTVMLVLYKRVFPKMPNNQQTSIVVG